MGRKNGMGKEKRGRVGVMAWGGRPEISPPQSFLKVGAYGPQNRNTMLVRRRLCAHRIHQLIQISR